jgi:hypothetical protein
MHKLLMADKTLPVIRRLTTEDEKQSPIGLFKPFHSQNHHVVSSLDIKLISKVIFAARNGSWKN